MNNPKAAAPFLILILVVTYGYAWALSYLPRFDQPSWVAIAAFNSGLAALSLILWRPAKLPESPRIETALAWALGPLLLIATGLVCWLSPETQSSPAAPELYTPAEILALCLWVPIIEEILFRRFLSNWLGQKFEGLWTIYLSALLFALAHTSPLTSPWPPLGPFLLGLVTTFCYRSSGRLLAPILLHAACNATAILFTYYAPSWLELLGGLYQKL